MDSVNDYLIKVYDDQNLKIHALRRLTIMAE